MTFTTQTMLEILPLLQQVLHTSESITFKALNPDLYETYAGTEITINQQVYIYRGYKSWSDLAELLHCKMLTPKETDYPFVLFRFKKIHIHSFHKDIKENEKYGTHSHFAKIHKMEEPAFYYYYLQALRNVKVEKRREILNLGVNRADEFTIIKKLLDTNKYEQLHLTGIDHSESAIKEAQHIFPEKNVTFHTSDIKDIDLLGLKKFDLLISIATLQSPSINFKPFFMHLIQQYMKANSAIILGFPNSRWVGGEIIYGAKAPNYVMSEMSLLWNDVMFCKKYLQQKKYRVTITGKHYIFLTATKIT